MRLVLALPADYEIPDLEHHLVAPSPRASPAPGAGAVPPSSRPHSPAGQPPSSQDGASFLSRSQTSAANGGHAAWSQPRLYLLRKGDSPHELDEQSRTSVHVVVTGRLALARVEAGSEVAAGGGRGGVGGGPGVGKSIFSDYSTATGEMAAAGAGAGAEGLASLAPSTPGPPSPVVEGGTGVSGGSDTPFAQPPPTPTPRMTSAALRGEVRASASLTLPFTFR